MSDTQRRSGQEPMVPRMPDDALPGPEELLRSVFSSMGEGVLLVMRTGEIALCNAAAERILGVTADQLRGLTPFDPRWRPIRKDGSPFPAEEHPGMVTLHTGKALRNEIMGVHRSDDTLAWISITSEPLRRAPEAPPHAVVVTFTDVTPLETARREQERMLENSAVAMGIGVHGTITWVNHQMTVLTGYTREELQGAPTSVLFSDESRGKARQEKADLLNRGGMFVMEAPLRRKDGSLAWVEIYTTRLDRLDTSKGALVVIIDHTEQRRAREMLQERDEHLRRIFEQHHTSMLLFDPETTRIIDANPAAARYYGYDRETFQKMTLSDINPMPEGEMKSAISGVVAGHLSLLVVMHRLQDGTERSVEVRASPIEMGGRTVVFALLQDVHEREQARKELARELAERRRLHREIEGLNTTLEERVAEAVRELREKDRLLIAQGRAAAMGEMLNNIAHQWRQPLNALRILLANLEDDAKLGPLDPKAVLEDVASGVLLVKKMSATIEDFSGFFRVEKERRRFDVLSQTRETVGLIRAAYQSAGITVEEEDTATILLDGFPNEYSHVLLNLLGNAKEAIEASSRAGGLIALRLFERDGKACLTVRDDGGGISEAVFEKIFDPYFSTKKSGSGIGLYMSRQIIERSFGGRIVARNVPGGAEFTLEMPLTPPESRGGTGGGG
ncbi:MAG: PAS domain-containing sensor histidine kinase [Polyangiaceae bacterium]